MSFSSYRDSEVKGSLWNYLEQRGNNKKARKDVVKLLYYPTGLRHVSNSEFGDADGGFTERAMLLYLPLLFVEFSVRNKLRCQVMTIPNKSPTEINAICAGFNIRVERSHLFDSKWTFNERIHHAFDQVHTPYLLTFGVQYTILAWDIIQIMHIRWTLPVRSVDI